MRVRSKIDFSAIYIYLIILNGVILSFLKYFKLDNISPINVILFSFFPFFLFKLLFNNRTNKLKKMEVLSFVFLSLVFIKLLIYIIYYQDVNSADILYYMLYTSGLFVYNYFARLSKERCLELLILIQKLSIIILVVSSLQFLFQSKLPKAFTDIPSLGNELGIEQYTREIDQIIIYRPNGLIGNPITFGFFLNIILAIDLFLFKAKIKNSSFYLIKIIFVVLTILFLYSRANILFMMFIFLISFFDPKKIGSYLIKFALVILSIALIYMVLLKDNPYIKYLIDRFSGNDAYSQQSNLEHINDYQRALSIISENPILGIAPYRNVSDKIITDGAFFIMYLQLGFFNFLIIIYFIFETIRKTLQNIKINSSTYPLLALLVFTFPISFMNSALINRSMLLYFFAIMEIISGLNTIQKNEN